MSILIDTNVILDIFLKREPFFSDSYLALRTATETGTDCYVSSSSVTDIFYILRKALQSSSMAKKYISDLMQLVSLADVLGSDIMDALASDMPDFEDAVADAIAKRTGAVCILTRNTKDFAQGTVSAITPTEYVKRYRYS